MKIVLICEAVFPENKGGLERWMFWLAQEFSRRGHEVTYINAANVNECRSGITFVSASKQSWHYVADGKRSIWQSIQFAISILPKVRKVNPDIVYSVQAPIFSIFSLAMMPRRKWILIIEWIEIWSSNYWKSYLGPMLGRVGFGLQYLATKFGDIRVVFTRRCHEKLGPNDKRNLLLAGLHINSSSTEFPSYGFKNDVLFLGRFVAEKQPLLAINAVEHFHNLGWKGNFYIVGTGPLATVIKEEITSRNMTRFVHILENAPQEELNNCFAKSFVLLHPSKREGYGLAMVEAAEKGIPTILINYPENASVDLGISPEFVTKSDDPAAIAELLQKAYSTQESSHSKLKEWATQQLPRISAVKSVDELILSIREWHTNA